MPISLQQHGAEPDLCFVLMPFDEQFSNLFAVVESVVKDYAYLTCVRADRIPGPSQITFDIWEHIQKSRFLIAVITGRNPNVFYEIGFSHALGKDVILLVQEGEKVPFDIQAIRYLRYKSDNLASLRHQLPKHIKECLQTLPIAGMQIEGRRTGVGLLRVEWPETGTLGHPISITAIAKNLGDIALEGYLSLSFPSGMGEIQVINSDLETKAGKKGQSWCSGQVILQYPIAEAYVSPHDLHYPWCPGAAHSITVSATPLRRGLIQFFASTSFVGSELPFMHDPNESPLRDQRNEPVYCGVIEVS
jgi:hypothetical protein